jgi:hypothetical protein
MADHLQVLGAGEVRIEMRLLGDIADDLAVGHGVAIDRLAAKENLAVGGLDEAGDHFEGGGLARAVGPEIAGDLAGGRHEADVLHGGDARVAFGDRVVPASAHPQGPRAAPRGEAFHPKREPDDHHR